MEVFTYISCMDTAYVRENPPPKWPKINLIRFSNYLPSILGTLHEILGDHMSTGEWFQVFICFHPWNLKVEPGRKFHRDHSFDRLGIPPNGGLESGNPPSKSPKNSGLGIIVICPD